MWQQRLKAWLDSIRARLARRGERTTREDADAYESRRRERRRRRRGGRLRPAPRRRCRSRSPRSPCSRRSRWSRHPPVQGVGRGEVGVRINQSPARSANGARAASSCCPACSGCASSRCATRASAPAQMSRADGPAPLQSVEGLSLGVDLTVRYAIDPLKVAALAKSLPDDVGAEIVEPAVQGVDLQGVRALHGARDLLDQARRDPAGDRDRAQAAPGRRRRRPAQRADRQDRPAGRLQARHGEPARRGARRREDALHARPQGKAGQGDRARRRSRRRCGARSAPRPRRASRSSPPRARKKR